MMIPVRKLILCAGLAVLGVSANAISIDQQAKIQIDKLQNNSRLNVQFSGAAVAMVELRLNGTSIGSSKFGTSVTKGEVGFGIDLDALHDGDNTLEIRLFDAAGTLVGTERTIITTEVSSGPVFLAMPKMGSTVQGAVEIKVGLGKMMKGVFVSYFVDNQFRSMTNSSPYEYIWDTQSDANGWHEVEAWVVDDSSNTFKTRKTRVFVNNPGGRTERLLPKSVDVQPVSNGTNVVTGAAAGIKAAPLTQGAATSTQATHIAPNLAVGATLGNPTTAPSMGKPADLRMSKTVQAVAAGVKLTTPTVPSITKVITPKIAPATRTLPKVSSASTVISTSRVSISKGNRLPEFGTYSILLNASVVSFDVAPRVQNGIPLTPFRHLFEKAGGKVEWDNDLKSVDAKAPGQEIWIKIGDKTARVNKLSVDMEIAPFLEKGRTVVPLSFIREALDVEVEYDPKTGHVLITSKK